MTAKKLSKPNLFITFAGVKTSRLKLVVTGVADAAGLETVVRRGADVVALDFRPGSDAFVRMVSSHAGTMPDYADQGMVRRETGDGSGAGEPSFATAGLFADDMPQNIVTRVYNYSLDIVALMGSERPVMMENLRRTLCPDIRVGVQLVKALAIEKASDLSQSEPYLQVADAFLFRPTDAFRRENGGDWARLMAAHYAGERPFLLEINAVDDREWLPLAEHKAFAGIVVDGRGAADGLGALARWLHEKFA